MRGLDKLDSMEAVFREGSQGQGFSWSVVSGGWRFEMAVPLAALQEGKIKMLLVEDRTCVGDDFSRRMWLSRGKIGNQIHKW